MSVLNIILKDPSVQLASLERESLERKKDYLIIPVPRQTVDPTNSTGTNSAKGDKVKSPPKGSGKYKELEEPAPVSGYFSYIRIPKIVSETEHLFHFQQPFSPPLQGMVFHQRLCYLLHPQDAHRGILRKSRQIKLVPGILLYEDFHRKSAFQSSSLSSVSSPKEEKQASEASKQVGNPQIAPGAGRGTGNRQLTKVVFLDEDEESEAAGLAVQVQKRALRDYSFEEEEWEIEAAK